jgi:intracellular sulfur oxidation DsrE/DsrF family protein
MQDKDLQQTSRRNFLGALAAGTATFSISTLASPLTAGAKSMEEKFRKPDDPEAWLQKLTGKHKMVFDVTQPHGVFPFAWPRVFLMTNTMTGTPEKENNVVVVLRHDAIPYAMETRLWEQYNFGEVFKATDPATNASSRRNPFWQPKAGDYKIPGFGEVAIGINELQQSGVIFVVCNAALTVYSTAVAQKMGKDPADVKKDWMSGLLPGIEVVPSGVWALGRAQEKGCAYCFAG